MRKKIGLVALAAVAGTLALGSVAYANDNDGHGYNGHSYHHKVQECDHSFLSGILQLPPDDDSDNSSDNDTDCDQHNSPDDD